MKIGAGVASVAQVALVSLGSLRAPRAEPKIEALTPERFLEVVLDAQDIVDDVALKERNYEDPPKGNCWGKPIAYTIPKSEAVGVLGYMIAGKALACYLVSYMGCMRGDYFVNADGARWSSTPKPFTRSKVTITEQTADRAVADVTEADYPPFSSCGNRCAGVLVSGDRIVRPFTDAEVDAVKTFSRYTITRGKDGRWQVTNREPSFEWACTPPPSKKQPARGEGDRRPSGEASAPQGPRVGGAADPSVRR